MTSEVRRELAEFRRLREDVRILKRTTTFFANLADRGVQRHPKSFYLRKIYEHPAASSS
jgi:hypothetical protein